MTINGKDHDVSDKDLLDLAASFDIKGGRKVLDTAREAVETFAEYAKTAGLTPEFAELIIHNHNMSY